MSWVARLLFGVWLLASGAALTAAQDAGPFAAHSGLEITTAFENAYGPDAESKTVISDVDASGIGMSYTSSRGVVSQRRVLQQDKNSAPTLVLGYARNMPEVIPNTTAIGLSRSALQLLRSEGSIPYSLIYDTSLSRIDGRLDLVKPLRVSVLIENQLVSLPALLASGTFGQGNRRAAARFHIYDDRNNPIILESTIRLNWEDRPRTERVVHVTAGISQRSAMEQTLSTIRKVDLYGIHFDFDKATIQPKAIRTIEDIAETLRLNPGWRLLINGHTDSIGKPNYNLKLSERRAATVKRTLVEKYGIAADRLETQGLGSSIPKGRNATLQGRKQNRRVELVRIDR
jgi:outer membrane protein OmpA-like peptidoglycan-associated protein